MVINLESSEHSVGLKRLFCCGFYLISQDFISEAPLPQTVAKSSLQSLSVATDVSFHLLGGKGYLPSGALASRAWLAS